MINAWSIYANGEPWDLLNGGAVAHHAARIFLTNRAIASEDGPIAARTVGLVIGRHIDGGMHEDIDVTNNSLKPVRFNLEIAIRADFADIFEVKSHQIVRRGRITTWWSPSRQTLRLTYRNKDFCREVIVHAAGSDSEPTVNANGRLGFDIALKAGQSWHRSLTYDLVDGTQRIRAPRECADAGAASPHARNMEEWRRKVLKIRTSNEEFYRCYNQGVQDMASLRLPLQGPDHMVFVPAAGLPWFAALFGRDTLVVSLQTMIVYPEFAAGTLAVLGRLQATEARRLPRRRARQDPARAALRGVGALQADPAHALLWHRRRDAALSGGAACSVAGDRRQRPDQAAFADCRSLPDLDRQIWRPRRRRVSGISNALVGRL